MSAGNAGHAVLKHAVCTGAQLVQCNTGKLLQTVLGMLLASLHSVFTDGFRSAQWTFTIHADCLQDLIKKCCRLSGRMLLASAWLSLRNLHPMLFCML